MSKVLEMNDGKARWSEVSEVLPEDIGGGSEPDVVIQIGTGVDGGQTLLKGDYRAVEEKICNREAVTAFVIDAYMDEDLRYPITAVYTCASCKTNEKFKGQTNNITLNLPPNTYLNEYNGYKRLDAISWGSDGSLSKVLVAGGRPSIADISAAPTMEDFNGLLAALRRAGVLAES